MATSIERTLATLQALTVTGQALAADSHDDGTIPGSIPAGNYTLDPTHSSLVFRFTRPIRFGVAIFNGDYAGHVSDLGGSRIGFSAEGVLQRSAFGIDFGMPASGSTIGVGDRAEIFMEAEFTRPRHAADD